MSEKKKEGEGEIEGAVGGKELSVEEEYNLNEYSSESEGEGEQCVVGVFSLPVCCGCGLRGEDYRGRDGERTRRSGLLCLKRQ